MKRETETPEEKINRPFLIEIIITLSGCLLLYILSANFDILEAVVEFSRRHEAWELDEIIPVFIFLVFALIVFSIRRWREVHRSKALLSERNRELEHALEEIKQLEGIIPICSSCKKIRNDAGFWEQVEHYVETYSQAKFSHSLCPECLDKFYGTEEWFTKEKK